MDSVFTKKDILTLISPRLKEEKENFNLLYNTNSEFKNFIDNRVEDYIKDPFVIFASDVSQAEVRVMAQLSQEERLIEIYNNQYKNLLEGKNIDEMKDVDFHYVTASHIYKKDINEITKTERKNAKTITFALLYGSSEVGIAERTDLTVKEAKELLNNFWSSYSKIRTWVGNNLEFAIKHGYIKTPMGRKRYTPNLLNKHELARNFWKNQYLGKDAPYSKPVLRQATSEARQCQNFPIQSYTSDIVLLGTSIIENQLRLKGIEHYLHTIIHDSIVMSIRFSQIQKVASIIHYVFENKIPKMLKLNMPMLMEVEVGMDCFSTAKLPFKHKEITQEEIKDKIMHSYTHSKGAIAFKTMDSDTIKDLLTEKKQTINISSQILKKYNWDKAEFNRVYKEYITNKQITLTKDEIENIFNLMKIS